jgi:hypothetical protein
VGWTPRGAPAVAAVSVVAMERTRNKLDPTEFQRQAPKYMLLISNVGRVSRSVSIFQAGILQSSPVQYVYPIADPRIFMARPRRICGDGIRWEHAAQVALDIPPPSDLRQVRRRQQRHSCLEVKSAVTCHPRSSGLTFRVTNGTQSLATIGTQHKSRKIGDDEAQTSPRGCTQITPEGYVTLYLWTQHLWRV